MGKTAWNHGPALCNPSSQHSERIFILGVTLQRADTHQREMVFPGEASGAAASLQGQVSQSRCPAIRGRPPPAPGSLQWPRRSWGGQFLTTPGGTPMTDGVNH